MIYPGDDAQLRKAHEHCRHNKSELADSDSAGCFYCLSVFNSSDVQEWRDAGTTALCPKCSIDSVIGSASGLEVDDISWLRVMHDRWFSQSE